MSDEIKHCPLCGCSVRVEWFNNIMGKLAQFAVCDTPSCPLFHEEVPLERWQDRPVENHLQNKIYELSAEIDRLRGIWRDNAEIADEVSSNEAEKARQWFEISTLVSERHGDDDSYTMPENEDSDDPAVITIKRIFAILDGPDYDEEGKRI